MTKKTSKTKNQPPHFLNQTLNIASKNNKQASSLALQMLKLTAPVSQHLMFDKEKRVQILLTAFALSFILLKPFCLLPAHSV